MNTFDPKSTALLFAIAEAEGRHPKPADGPTHRFPIWDTPLVRVNEMYGKAVGYTRSYGLVTWNDGAGGDHMEWFPADLIQRVKKEDWHGR